MTGATAPTATACGGDKDNPARLEPLREDLLLKPAPPQKNGAPSWTLHDPVCHRFFRIGRPEFELLSRWHLGREDALVAAINTETPLAVGPASITALQGFLAANHLLRRPPALRKKPGVTKQLLHHYLYFRLPLWHPDAFLEKAEPYVRFLFAAGFWKLIFILGIAGIYFASRQWDVFQQTFLYFFSAQGLTYYALTLFFAKAAHELGHALSAKRYGLRVPTMGVAFIVLWPVLFTDTTEAWKLTSRRKRLTIDAAGVLTETAIAVLATLLWNFMPVGPMKSAMFLLATTTWVTTLAINLSPFMRFDGYYLLSDLLDIPNLQERSFAMGRWFLRKILLGASESRPENLPRRETRFMLVYCYATWMYRFFLFLGIALTVYHLFFKALGIMLMAVELLWFICGPIFRELRVWHRIGSSQRITGNIIVTGFFLAGLLFLLAYPWATKIETPAIVKPAAQARLFSPMAARIRGISASLGKQVNRGDILFELESPRLDFLQKKAASEVKMLQLRLQRINFSDEEAERIQVVQHQLAEAMSSLNGYREQRKRLRIIAPIGGEILELDETLTPGQWVNESNPLALIVDRRQLQIEGLVREKDLARIRRGSTARFYPEDTELKPLNALVKKIDPAHTGILNEPYLASLYGGGVAVRRSGQGQLVAHETLYRVILSPVTTDTSAAPNIFRGTARIQGEPMSFLQRAWVQIVGVLVRESDF